MYVCVCTDHVEKQPTRKKIFSEVRNSEDMQVWNVNIHSKTIRCAKVHNPAILTQPGNNTWSELAGVQRLEIEDPEATLSTIPKQLFTELRYLESLSVTWTKIKSLPSALFQLPLNSLYLQRNQIKTLSGIEKATELTILDISNNRLDCLPKTFGQLQNLVTLNLSGNGLQELPESVGFLSHLKMLDCSCNKLRSLPDSLSNIIALTSLDVSTNQLTSLPESIGSLPELEDLRARSNQLVSLPDSFGQLHRLNSLVLRNNKFEDVPEQLSHLTHLQSLNMRENMIRHVDRPISSLRYLILDQNYLTQIDVGILQCTNLQYLSLKSNQLVDVTGSIIKLANVRSLNLSDNAIAEVPAGLDRLTHLHHLSLCSTKIHTIPLAVAGMPSLSTLELEECSELDGYLNIAYKTDGLRGVVEYLKKNERPGSIYPVDLAPNESENNRALRNLAGKSLVPETSVTPPASGATLPGKSGGRTFTPQQPVHVARQSLYPPERSAKPSKPYKPLDLATDQTAHVARQSLYPPERPAKPSKPYKPLDLATDRQSQSHLSTTGKAESASFSNPVQPTSQLETVAESSTVATITQFSNPISGSSSDTSRQEEQERSSRDVGQTAAQRDSAVVARQLGEPNSLDTRNTSTAGVSATSVAKPRPPTKKKPSKIVT